MLLVSEDGGSATGLWRAKKFKGRVLFDILVFYKQPVHLISTYFKF